MRIRPATRDDVPALLEIEAGSFRTDLLTARKLRRLLAHGRCDLVVAAEGAEILGYALVLYRATSRAARIYGLAVHPAHRGAGHGRALLAASERLARRAGCGRVTLEVDPRNADAVNLYLKNGYERIAGLGPYYEDGAEADRYAKVLAKARR